jgi:hypothetical protein
LDGGVGGGAAEQTDHGHRGHRDAGTTAQAHGVGRAVPVSWRSRSAARN